MTTATDSHVAGAARAPRGPAAVYGTATLVIVVLLAGLALTARQPAPPNIAELAPQAEHQIHQAPSQQSGAIGSAPGGAGAAGATTTTAPPAGAPTTLAAKAPPPIYLPAVHRCYGNPPRQISFDTQSPPCIAYWQGDNGGATSRGVTGNSIEIALLSNGGDARAIQDLETFFNRTFEFYGRQLKLKNLGQGPKSSYSGDSCTYQRTAADTLEKVAVVFAVTDPNTSAPSCFLDEAAANKIVTISGTPWFSESALSSRTPFLWQYTMGSDQVLAHTGAMMCSDLAGRDASYSPDRLMKSQPRKFGVIAQYYDGQTPPDLTPLRSQFAKCGGSLAQVVNVKANLNTNSAALADDYAQVVAADKQAVLAMQSAGVSTVVCWCLVFMEDGLGPSADAQQYQPEWLVVGPGQDLDVVIKAFWADANQERALMGLSYEPRQVPYSETTLNQAIASVDPGYQINSDEATWLHNQDVYWMLLLLASGIQMAGPHLTPETFQHALQTTSFPNPVAPLVEGAVGFGGGSHAMTIDAEPLWWSPNTNGPMADETGGTWCYTNGGRHHLGDWPTGPSRLFQGPCMSS
jgi:hypothetical protein